MRFNSFCFYTAILLLSGSLLAGCQDHTTETAAVTDSRSMMGPLVWGTADKVIQYGNLYFAGQPDQAGLQAARDAGVDIVINLRPADEMDWDEAAAVSEMGMQYINIPIAKSGPGFDPAAIERLNEIIGAQSHDDILLHCSSGNRAIGWYAVYLVEEKDYTPERALGVAQLSELTREGMETRVREYLGRP